MWILHFLPDSLILWFTNLLLLAGVALTVAGWFAHKIPLIYQYQLPFKILGGLLLASGVYFRGGYAVEMQWRERVAEVEAKLKKSEEQAAVINQKLEQLAESKVKVIRGRTEYIKQYIDREVVRYDTKFLPGGICEIPESFVRAHNDAVARPKQ